MELTQDSITFGKYKGKTILDLLRDKTYCEWLLKQEWFIQSYEYLYKKIKDYDPLSHLIEIKSENQTFIENYDIFNLRDISTITIFTLDSDKVCYNFYRETILNLKNRIQTRINDNQENPYDIKAPQKWLKIFEESTGMSRETFKEFMIAYNLPNITTVVERIKCEGGIEYKGSKSFKIAKNRSEEQEKWWEMILKSHYSGENIGVQYKYNECIFDFIHIPNMILFECKLGMKDFNAEQYKKYTISLEKYKPVYLIGKDCVIDIKKQTLNTINIQKYKEYIEKIPCLKSPSYLDLLLLSFSLCEFNTIQDCIINI